MKAIYLDKTDKPDIVYRYALWADVPGGLQASFKDPTFNSAYRGATLAEITSLRTGVTAEKVASKRFESGTALPTVDAWIEAELTAWQAEVTAGDLWTNYGRFYNGVSWTAGSAPPDEQRLDAGALPTFIAFTPVSAFAANKFHFVLYNNSSYYAVRVQTVLFKPGTSTVTGAVPSEWTLRRRLAPTAAPSGGGVTPIPMSTQDTLPAGITLHNAPTTAPSGGTAQDLIPFLPQADEQKLSTFDAPTFASVQPLTGYMIYDAHVLEPVMPLMIEPLQTLEIQASATAGTGNCRILIVFCIQDIRNRFI